MGMCGAANAALTIDVRALQINGANIGGANTAKSITQFAVGDVITFGVFADVTGSNPAKFQTLQSFSGSFLSTGGTTLGNMVPAASRAVPFNASSSSVGLAQDLDNDGDLDIGSNNDADAANFFADRANVLIGPHSTNDQGGSPFGTTPPTSIPGGTEYRAGTLRLTITAAGTPTLVNFRPRVAGTAATWSEDADENVFFDPDLQTNIITYSGGTVGTIFLAGTPVAVGVGGGTTPEPATLSLAGLAGLAMVRRRRA
jgi:MYXO-CTERM domain-containing protein